MVKKDYKKQKTPPRRKFPSGVPPILIKTKRNEDSTRLGRPAES